MRQAKLRERIDSRTCSHIGGIRRWVQRGLQRDRRYELTIKGSASINILIGDRDSKGNRKSRLSLEASRSFIKEACVSTLRSTKYCPVLYTLSTVLGTLVRQVC